MNKPNINVTPLIDVLLVLLIIFMVVSPLKPSSFRARVPSERRIDSPAKTNPDTLIVMVGNDSTLRLNDEVEMGETDDPAKLIARLKDVFNQRIVSEAFADDPRRHHPCIGPGGQRVRSSRSRRPVAFRLKDNRSRHAHPDRGSHRGRTR